MAVSKSKASGASSDEAGKQPLAMPSIVEEKKPNISDMSDSSQEKKSLIGFQPTKALDVDEKTTNAKLVTTFASKLGILAHWERIEVDGVESYALCFPLKYWTTNAQNELVIRKEDELGT